MRASERDLSTDEGLLAFIDSLPDEAELRGELGDVLPQKRCAVCRSLLPIGTRADTKTCSQNCRQALYEARLKPTGCRRGRDRTCIVLPGKEAQ